MSGPKILTIDIETSPNLAHVWGLFNQNVSLSQLQDTGQVICFAAKWYGSDKILYYSDHHHGHRPMISRAWELLNEADVLVHYNGTKFDVPHMMREFVEDGVNPPSPFQEIDLLKTVRKKFRFTSNKLDHVSRQLGLEGKLSHTGHDLWVRCMAGDGKAWNLMRKYNKQDVALTEQLYDRLRPWIVSHPNMNLWVDGDDGPLCPKCGSGRLHSRGKARTKLVTYVRYQCQDCGAWSRSSAREAGVKVQEEL